MELHEKINSIKEKVLNALESKIDDAHILELKEIAEIIKIVADDSNLYLKILTELSGKGYGFGKKEETQTADTADAE